MAVRRSRALIGVVWWWVVAASLMRAWGMAVRWLRAIRRLPAVRRLLLVVVILTLRRWMR
jgi:hypothetical protein